MVFIIVQGDTFQTYGWMLFFDYRLLLHKASLHTVECGSVKSDLPLSS